MRQNKRKLIGLIGDHMLSEMLTLDARAEGVELIAFRVAVDSFRALPEIEGSTKILVGQHPWLAPAPDVDAAIEEFGSPENDDADPGHVLATVRKLRQLGISGNRIAVLVRERDEWKSELLAEGIPASQQLTEYDDDGSLTKLSRFLP